VRTGGRKGSGEAGKKGEKRKRDEVEEQTWRGLGERQSGRLIMTPNAGVSRGGEGDR